MAPVTTPSVGKKLLAKKDYNALKRMEFRIFHDILPEGGKGEAMWSKALLEARICFRELTRSNRKVTLKVILKLLNILKSKLPDVKMEYEVEERFLQRYPEFRGRSVNEREKLRQTANWMHILFCNEGILGKAESKKGLVMTAVCKFLGKKYALPSQRNCNNSCLDDN